MLIRVVKEVILKISYHHSEWCQIPCEYVVADCTGVGGLDVASAVAADTLNTGGKAGVVGAAYNVGGVEMVEAWAELNTVGAAAAPGPGAAGVWLGLMRRPRIPRSDIWRRWVTGGMRASVAGSLPTSCFMSLRSSSS